MEALTRGRAWELFGKSEQVKVEDFSLCPRGVFSVIFPECPKRRILKQVRNGVRESVIGGPWMQENGGKCHSRYII